MPQFSRGEVVEAFQMTRDARDDVSAWPTWLQEAWNRRHTSNGALKPVDFPYSDGTDELLLRTADTWAPVRFDDWLVQTSSGGVVVMRPSAFARRYRLVG